MCGYHIEYPDEKRIEVKNIFKKFNNAFGVKKIIEEYLKWNIPVFTCCMLIDSKIIIKNKLLYDISLRYGEDQLFNLKVLYNARKISFVKKDLLGYVQHDSNTMKKIRTLRYLDLLKSLRLIRVYLDKSKDKSLICSLTRYKIPKTILIILSAWAGSGYNNKYFSFIRKE